jgi:hypothetical protein
MFFVSNLLSYSQAGRRGFDSRLPLQLFNTQGKPFKCGLVLRPHAIRVHSLQNGLPMTAVSARHRVPRPLGHDVIGPFEPWRGQPRSDYWNSERPESLAEIGSRIALHLAFGLGRKMPSGRRTQGPFEVAWPALSTK